MDWQQIASATANREVLEVLFETNDKSRQETLIQKHVRAIKIIFDATPARERSCLLVVEGSAPSFESRFHAQEHLTADTLIFVDKTEGRAPDVYIIRRFDQVIKAARLFLSKENSPFFIEYVFEKEGSSDKITWTHERRFKDGIYVTVFYGSNPPYEKVRMMTAVFELAEMHLWDPKPASVLPRSHTLVTWIYDDSDLEIPYFAALKTLKGKELTSFSDFFGQSGIEEFLDAAKRTQSTPLTAPASEPAPAPAAEQPAKPADPTIQTLQAKPKPAVKRAASTKPARQSESTKPQPAFAAVPKQSSVPVKRTGASQAAKPAAAAVVPAPVKAVTPPTQQLASVQATPVVKPPGSGKDATKAPAEGETDIITAVRGLLDTVAKIVIAPTNDPEDLVSHLQGLENASDWLDYYAEPLFKVKGETPTDKAPNEAIILLLAGLFVSQNVSFSESDAVMVDSMVKINHRPLHPFKFMAFVFYYVARSEEVRQILAIRKLFAALDYYARNDFYFKDYVAAHFPDILFAPFWNDGAVDKVVEPYRKPIMQIIENVTSTEEHYLPVFSNLVGAMNGVKDALKAQTSHLAFLNDKTADTLVLARIVALPRAYIHVLETMPLPPKESCILVTYLFYLQRFLQTGKNSVANVVHGLRLDRSLGMTVRFSLFDSIPGYVELYDAANLSFLKKADTNPKDIKLPGGAYTDAETAVRGQGEPAPFTMPVQAAAQIKPVKSPQQAESTKPQPSFAAVPKQPSVPAKRTSASQSAKPAVNAAPVKSPTPTRQLASVVTTSVKTSITGNNASKATTAVAKDLNSEFRNAINTIASIIIVPQEGPQDLAAYLQKLETPAVWIYSSMAYFPEDAKDLPSEYAIPTLLIALMAHQNQQATEQEQDMLFYMGENAGLPQQPLKFMAFAFYYLKRSQNVRLYLPMRKMFSDLDNYARNDPHIKDFVNANFPDILFAPFRTDASVNKMFDLDRDKFVVFIEKIRTSSAEAYEQAIVKLAKEVTVVKNYLIFFQRHAAFLEDEISDAVVLAMLVALPASYIDFIETMRVESVKSLLAVVTYLYALHRFSETKKSSYASMALDIRDSPFLQAPVSLSQFETIDGYKALYDKATEVVRLMRPATPVVRKANDVPAPETLGPVANPSRLQSDLMAEMREAQREADEFLATAAAKQAKATSSVQTGTKDVPRHVTDIAGAGPSANVDIAKTTANKTAVRPQTAAAVPEVQPKPTQLLESQPQRQPPASNSAVPSAQKASSVRVRRTTTNPRDINGSLSLLEKKSDAVEQRPSTGNRPRLFSSATKSTAVSSLSRVTTVVQEQRRLQRERAQGPTLFQPLPQKAGSKITVNASSFERIEPDATYKLIYDAHDRYIYVVKNDAPQPFDYVIKTVSWKSSASRFSASIPEGFQVITKMPSNDDDGEWYTSEARAFRVYSDACKGIGAVRFYHAWQSGPWRVPILGSPRTYMAGHIAMEYLEYGSLHDVKTLMAAYAKADPVAGTVWLTWGIPALFKYVLEGLRTLHRMGHAHYDLKSTNMALRKDGQCVLIDFGMADVEGHYEAGTELFNFEYRVPLGWRSPQNPKFGKREDMFALGVTILEVIAGFPTLGQKGEEQVPQPKDFPFPAKYWTAMEDYLRRGTVLPSPEYYNSKYLFDFMRRLICYEKERMPIDQAIDHPYMASSYVDGTGIVSAMAIAVSTKNEGYWTAYAKQFMDGVNSRNEQLLKDLARTPDVVDVVSVTRRTKASGFAEDRPTGKLGGQKRGFGKHRRDALYGGRQFELNTMPLPTPGSGSTRRYYYDMRTGQRYLEMSDVPFASDPDVDVVWLTASDDLPQSTGGYAIIRPNAEMKERDDHVMSLVAESDDPSQIWSILSESQRVRVDAARLLAEEPVLSAEIRARIRDDLLGDSEISRSSPVVSYNAWTATLDQIISVIFDTTDFS